MRKTRPAYKPEDLLEVFPTKTSLFQCERIEHNTRRLLAPEDTLRRDSTYRNELLQALLPTLSAAISPALQRE